VSRWPATVLLLALSPLWVTAAGAQDYPDYPPPGFPQSAADAPQEYPYDDPTDQAPSPEQYEGALRPYGSWQADPQYGRFWRPGVPSGWQPYSDGQWAWTRYGWTWVSYEPWSWTFHYGRWAQLPWGWSWFPGSTWGPAWVNWSTYGGYVGWAPLSPFGLTPINRYLFVRDYDFCAPRLRGRYVPYHRVPWHVREHWRDHPRWPDRQEIERVSRHRVRVLPDRPRETLAPWQRDGGRRAGRRGPDGDDDRRDERQRPREDRRPDRPNPDRGPRPPMDRPPDAPGQRDVDRRPGNGGDDSRERPGRVDRNDEQRRRLERAERPWFPWPRGERPAVSRPPDDGRRGPGRRADGERPGGHRPPAFNQRPSFERPRAGGGPDARAGGAPRWSGGQRPQGGGAPDRPVSRDAVGKGRGGGDGRGRSGSFGRGGGGAGLSVR
jgi:hypothetical protein